MTGGSSVVRGCLFVCLFERDFDDFGVRSLHGNSRDLSYLILFVFLLNCTSCIAVDVLCYLLSECACCNI